MEEERIVYSFLRESPKERDHIGRPRFRWENGFRMDLREIGWGV
jgi:hypothetical protein